MKANVFLIAEKNAEKPMKAILSFHESFCEIGMVFNILY